MVLAYRRLLADRRFSVGTGAVALSAVALGMIPLALILGSSERPLATGAVAAGAFGVGNALGVPAQGMLMARVPARVVLLTSAAVSCALLVLATVVPSTAAFPVLLAGAGLAFPAIAAAFRASIPVSFVRSTERTGAYALLSIAFQAGLATGPVVAAVLTASDVRPFVLAVAAAVVAPASVLLAVSMETPGAVATKGRGRGRGRSIVDVPVFARIVAIAALVSVASGSLTVTVPAMLEVSGTRGAAGVVLAGLALGEATGASAFGSRRAPGSRRMHLLVALSLAAGGYLTLAAITGGALLLGLLVFAIGTLTSPVTIVLSAMLDDVVPPPLIASAYGVVVSAAVGGAALGTSTAGLVVSVSGQTVGGGVIAVAAVVVAAALSAPRFENGSAAP